MPEDRYPQDRYPQDRYNVVFAGEWSPDTTQDAARRNLQAWFKLDDAQLANLFSGRRVIVKRNVSLDMASRYQAAFRKAGGLALIEISVDEAANVGADKAADANADKTADAGADKAADGGANEAADTDANEATAAGQEEHAGSEASPQPATDVTALALAPVGSPLEEIDDRGPPQSPDISALSLVPGSGWSLEDCEPELPPPPTFDIDGMELVPIPKPPPPKQAD